MAFMIVPGVLTIIFGIIFIVAPQRLMSQREPHARPLISPDALFLDHRICAGICLIAIGVFCLLSSFYVWLRLNYY